MKSKVAILGCANYDPSLVDQKLSQLISLLGGLEQFIRPGSKVLVKPNMLMAKPPEAGITTHPAVVRAVIRQLLKLDCRVWVGDSPSVWGKYIENVDQVYQVCGIKQLCLEEGVQLVSFEKRRMRRDFPLASVLDQVDALVNIPKLKTHELMLITGAIKNLFGLVSGTFKTELHKSNFHPEDFARVLLDIYEQAKPNITIVDGILAMEGDGPATSGKLRDLGLLLAGNDAVAIDSVIADIIGVKPEDCFTIQEARRRQIGRSKLSEIEIVGEDYRALKIKPFLLPASARKNKLPKVILNIISRLIRYYPLVLKKKCLSCSACVNICPQKCVSLKEGGIRFNYTKCIACFCCQEACPAAAIRVKKSLLAKLIGL
ncbi:MAG: DUF362 domain-containing protein [Candidatus Omnitrophica bacterium]|jgi:uncharacterized protein (DUF362 family)/Pyruvate/2-oxoacid:ferredoxin oxidoreductase delta subunit|nr:DUF362 domain-containing protein [Candidatus Omnitrophota bacterium]